MRIILSLFLSSVAVYASSQPCNQQVIASSGTNGVICGGAPLNLFASPVPGATYSWTGPAGFTSSQPNTVDPTPTTAGNYIVTATVGSCVYKDTFYANIIVVPKPIISKSSSLKPVFANPFCIKDELMFSPLNTLDIDSIIFTTPTYSNTALGTTPLFHVNNIQTGNYIMQYEKQGCHSLPDITAVVTVPVMHPVVSLIGDPNVKPYTTTTFTAAVSNGPSQPDLRWFKNGVELKNNNTYTLTVIPGVNVSDNDQLWVLLVGDTTGCLDSAISNILSIHVDLGVNKLNDETFISFYPNPALQTLFIQTKTLVHPLQAYLTDMNGRRLRSRQLFSNSKDAIDMQELSPGLYMLELWDNGRRLQVNKVVHQ